MTGIFRNRGMQALAAGKDSWMAPHGSAWPRLAMTGLAACLAFWPIGAWADYTLRPGDTIAVSTFGVFDITHQSVVDFDGNVTLPVIGRMAVAGLTLSEVQTQVAGSLSAEPLRLVDGDGLERWLNLQPAEILVEISSYAPVFVSGVVATPGKLDYTPGMTVRQLIAEAGGLGLGTAADDPDGQRSIELAAEREIAAQRVAAVMGRVSRLQEELRAISAEMGDPAVDEDAPAQAEEPAAIEEPPATSEAPAEVTDETVAELLPADAEPGFDVQLTEDAFATIPRPPARPAEVGGSQDPGPELALDDAEPAEPLVPLEAEAAESPEPTVQLVADETDPALPFRSDAGGGLDDISRQLVEAGALVRGVDASASRALLDEMNTRLDLLRRRQTDEETLLQRDREEVARVKDLIERGLVPESEAAVAERSLLLSSMQSYETEDAIARLEIELARLVADLERAPSEAARDVLTDLESQLAEAEIALAQLDAVDQRLALVGGPVFSDSAITYEFMLHRGSGDSTVAQKVGQDELLLPGDVLEVVAIMPDPTQ